MEDAMIIIKKGEIQDLRDPFQEKERPGYGSETKIPRVSEASLGALTPWPKFILSRQEDRAGPSSVDAYGSSAPLSLRPISKLHLYVDRAGPEIVDACSEGLSTDIKPTEGETKSNKKRLRSQLHSIRLTKEGDDELLWGSSKLGKYTVRATYVEISGTMKAWEFLELRYIWFRVIPLMNEAVFRLDEHQPKLMFEKAQLRAYEWVCVRWNKEVQAPPSSKLTTELFQFGLCLPVV
ncbi:hypothetical protein Ancab_015852 [Ancistrocladus abbreviatus]